MIPKSGNRLSEEIMVSSENEEVRPSTRAVAGTRWPTCQRNVAFMGEHLLQIGDIGGGLIGRQIGARDVLGLRETALQADDECQILPHPWIHRLMVRGAPQCRLGLFKVLRQRVGQSEIG